MKPIEECKLVSELLAEPSRWVRDVYGLDAAGCVVLGGELHEGVCFCLTGAIRRIYDGDSGPMEPTISRIEKAADKIRPGWQETEECCDEIVAAWNDAPERTHPEVLALAIQLGI